MRSAGWVLMRTSRRYSIGLTSLASQVATSEYSLASTFDGKFRLAGQPGRSRASEPIGCNGDGASADSEVTGVLRVNLIASFGWRLEPGRSP